MCAANELSNVESINQIDYKDFAWMLRGHEDRNFAYFDLRLENAVVESMNNNAKAISHRARSCRREEDLLVGDDSQTRQA